MRSKLILLFLFCSTLVCTAQRIEVTKGPVVDPKQLRSAASIPKGPVISPFKSFSYSTALFFNPKKKRTYSGFGFQDKAFQFAVLEDYLKYTGIKQLTSESINDRVMLGAFIFISDKLYVVYCQKFPEQDVFSVYVNEVSEDLVVLGSPILVHNFKGLKQYGMNVFVSSSEDKKFMLITRLQDTKAKENQKIECKAIDQAFSEVWYKFIEMESLDKELALKTIDVDNAGNLFMLVEHQVGKVNKPKLYSYFWNTKSLKTFDLGPNTGENFGTKMELLNGEKPYVVGLNKNEKAVSYFMNRVDAKSMTLENLGASPMPDGFYEASKVRMFDTEDWAVADMITLSNNTIVASIEALLVDPKYGLHASYNTYVVSFKEDGSHNWSRTIQKKQQASPGLAGHILIPAENSVLVLYNDDEKNITKKPEDTKVAAYMGKDAMAVVQEIDAAGKVMKYPLTKDKELDGYALYFASTAKIEKDFYYSTCFTIKGMFNVEARNITLRIK
ncbi:MAG TPA: hypothetical protein VK589_00950 [Chryseolinea sp.]|nr:hypothetical protein [Chryseolinea sp.]